MRDRRLFGACPESVRKRINGASGRGTDLCRKCQRLVGAVVEFDGHEDHLFVADILQICTLN